MSTRQQIPAGGWPLSSQASRDDHVPPASARMLDACIPLFEVMKDPNRQRMFATLVERGDMTVGDLAATTVLDRTTVSHHLKVLQHAGLVDVRKQGRQRVCRARAAEALHHLRLLVAALESDLAAAEACRAMNANTP